MATDSGNRHTGLTWRAGWIILLCILLSIGIYVCSSRVPIIYAIDTDGRILIAQHVNTGTTLESQYIHSVARCPIIEKFEINETYDIVLMESWNCSFGAGIETETPDDASTRMENGYYVYENINQPFSEIAFHAVALNDHTLTIDDKTWELSKHPFRGTTLTIFVTEERRLAYWKHKLQLF